MVITGKKNPNKKQLKNGDLLLLFLYVDNCSPIRGRTRLQKMAFIFEKEILKQAGFDKKLDKKSDSAFDFKAHKYGPFSASILELMDFFINIGMIDVTCTSSSEHNTNTKDYEEALGNIDDEDIFNVDLTELSNYQDADYTERDYCREPIYKLTQLGEGYVKNELIPYLSEDQLAELTKLKVSFNQYSLRRVLKYVYTKYQQWTTESIIKEKVLEES